MTSIIAPDEGQPENKYQIRNEKGYEESKAIPITLNDIFRQLQPAKHLVTAYAHLLRSYAIPT